MSRGEARGEAHAAIGVVNAIGSGGLGAAAALALRLEARMRSCSSYQGSSLTRGRVLEIEPAILRSVDEVVAARLGLEPLGGLCAEAWSEIPLEAGFKGSSALVNALVEATLRLRGREPPGLLELAQLGVEAARKAGLTITGALDDHLATLGCGLYATDNTRQEMALHLAGVEGYVAAIVPGRRSIRSIDPAVFRRWRGLYLAAWRSLAQGDWRAAATLNGLATLLATRDEAAMSAVEKALRLGAAAAGVTGKGPGVYAVAATRGEAEALAKAMREELPGEALVAELITCGRGGARAAAAGTSPSTGSPAP